MQAENYNISVPPAIQEDGDFYCETVGNCSNEDCSIHWNGVDQASSYNHYAHNGPSNSILWPGYASKVSFRLRPSARTSRKNWNNYQSYTCTTSRPSSSMNIIQQVCDTSSYTHIRQMRSAYPYAGFIDSNGAWPFGRPGSPDNGGMPAMADTSSSTDLVSVPGDLSNLIEMSLRQMLPGIKQKLSLINSIYELKDFEHVAKSLRTLRVGKVSSFLKTLPKTLSLRSALRAVSKTHLTLAFAIIPLMQDITGMYRVLVDTTKEVNDLVTRENKLVTRHFAWHTNESVAEDTTSAFYTPLSSRSNDVYIVPIHGERIARQLGSKFHAQIEYSYSLTQYQRKNAQALGYLDSLGIGVSRTPEIIWNAIPWSFAIDWVIQVNNFLRSFAPKNLEPAVNIHRYLWSIKRKRVTEVRIKADNSPPDREAAKTAHKLMVVIESAYRREVTMPSKSLLLEVGGFSPKELLLGASLVFARGRR